MNNQQGAMAGDLLAASRRPLQRLLHECSFSEWENIALFLDDGTTEAVRWAGGLGFVLEELGISQVLDLQVFAPGRGGLAAAKDPESEGLTRGIFLVTNFLWDVEGAVLNAARTYGLTEVTLACSISEEAHACHPHAAHISEETGGRASFSVVSQQLKVSLERMLKIEAQSSSSNRQRFSSPPSSLSQGPYSSPTSTETALFSSAIPLETSTEHPGSDDPSVSVTVIHSPLHMGCFFQPPTTKAGASAIAGDSANTARRPASWIEQQHQHRKGWSAFSLASPTCARVFPLRRCDWEGGGGVGAGAALFAAAAAVEGGGGGDGDTEGRVSAEEVPREERLRFRLLAHTLVETLWDQLLLDVSGGGGVFALGDTSRLIGTTVAAVAEDVKRTALDRPTPSAFGGEGLGRSSSSNAGANSSGSGGQGLGGSWISAPTRREASVVLVDRTLDLAAAASHGGSLLQRILSSVARTGTERPVAASSSPSSSSPPNVLAAEAWSPSLAAHQQDVGVALPMLTPGLGLPARRSAGGAGSDGGSGGGSDNPVVSENCGEKPPRLLAMKALAGFAWPAPPSLCHAGRGGEAAAGVVHALASLGEEEGQAALISALEKCVSDNGCVPPPRKRRGMGSSIMALVTSLARGSPRAGGLSGNRVSLRCRSMIQVALAAMEAHQRTSSLSGSSWPETLAAERAQLQQLRDGGTVDVVMEQLCATLKRMPPAASSTSTTDALLLALRGVSLAGESIGAEDASSFRKAWISRMLEGGGFREQGSGVPPGVAEGVERVRSRREQARKALEAAAAGNVGETAAEGDQEEAGVLLELEDIARERMQRLREAAASRSFHLKNTAVLRDLAFEPYTFVASAVAAANATVPEPKSLAGGGGGGEEGWDDWGDDETGQESSSGDGGEVSLTAHSTECDTLVGRLVGLLLDRDNPDIPDLHEAKLVSAASVGLGLLSSGLKKLGRIGGAATGGVRRGRIQSIRPADRPVVVIFVVGGFTPQELAEVSGVLRCAAAAAAAGGGRLDTEVILAGTTVSTPDVVYEQIFTRPAGGSG